MNETTTTTTTTTTKPSPELVSHVFDDLCSRFIINTPPEELDFTNTERVCFLVEEAFWFYQDFFQEELGLQSLNLREFTRQIFYHCPLLRAHCEQVDSIVNSFRLYKVMVPVYGAIILNPKMDKCLLVKGWNSRSSWSFPRGKVNKDEPMVQCAIREVLEETGFDISDKIHESEYLETTVREQHNRLYIIANIGEDVHFAPRTRKEISDIQWFSVDSLPYSYNNASSSPPIPYHQRNHFINSPHQPRAASNFFMIIPFVRKLRQWIQQHSQSYARRKSTNLQHRHNWIPPNIQVPIRSPRSSRVSVQSSPVQLPPKDSSSYPNRNKYCSSEEAEADDEVTPEREMSDSWSNEPQSDWPNFSFNLSSLIDSLEN